MLTTKIPPAPRTLPPDTRKSKGSFARAAGSFVPKLTAKAFERYGFHSAEIMTAWARVAGADLAGFTEPERIKWPRGHERVAGDDAGAAHDGATLVLRVDPARALDVEYRGAEIIDRINRYFGYRAISRLKIIQAPMSTRPSVAGTALSGVAAPEPPQNLSPDTEPVLKTALLALWASIAAERQLKG